MKGLKGFLSSRWDVIPKEAAGTVGNGLPLGGRGSSFILQGTKHLPSIVKRPILSIRRADTMFPGNTANVPRKLTK